MASPRNENSSTSSPREKNPCPMEVDVLDCVPKLSSERNYKKWKLLIRDFIRMRGLTSVIEGKERGLTIVIEGEESNRDEAWNGSNIKGEESNRDEAWNGSNNLVRGLILATLSEETRLQVMEKESAKDLLKELEDIFGAPEEKNTEWRNTRADEEEEIRKRRHEALQEAAKKNLEDRQHRYLDLQKAAIKGYWKAMVIIIEHDHDAARSQITRFNETALHLAVSSGSPRNLKNHFVRELLKKMTREDVCDLVDVRGGTALHYAAEVNYVYGAKMLIEKNLDLPNAQDLLPGGNTPLHWAAQFGHREMVDYLMKKTDVPGILANDDRCAWLLRRLTHSEFYDIALKLLQKKPELAYKCACMKSPSNLLAIIAEKPSSFKSGDSSKFWAIWHTLIYWGVPEKLESIANHHNEGGTGDIEDPATTNCCISVMQRLYIKIWEVAKLVPYVKRIQEKKERQYHALKLVKFLCKEVAKSKHSEVEMIFKPTLRKAACLGIPEIIEEIVSSYPSALFFVPDDQNIITYAILNRRERVFNLVHQTGWSYIYGIDRSSTNVLHLVARLGREQQINLNASAAGAVLQMQREMQWYKEVEKLTPPGDRESKNIDGMTPAEVFSDTHQDLLKEAERWMKDTATSCTIVSALIAAVVFAAAITVPGGNDNENGHPLLLKREAFIVFGICNALALFSSITSMLTFLLILTSRYADEDFQYTLPRRLILGLVTLFVSILTTMVSFGAILYIVFGDFKTWILIPIGALACIPVTLFGALQFPLLVDMIHSTYVGVFSKKSDPVLR